MVILLDTVSIPFSLSLSRHFLFDYPTRDNLNPRKNPIDPHPSLLFLFGSARPLVIIVSYPVTFYADTLLDLRPLSFLPSSSFLSNHPPTHHRSVNIITRRSCVLFTFCEVCLSASSAIYYCCHCRQNRICCAKTYIICCDRGLRILYKNTHASPLADIHSHLTLKLVYLRKIRSKTNRHSLALAVSLYIYRIAKYLLSNPRKVLLDIIM